MNVGKFKDLFVNKNNSKETFENYQEIYKKAYYDYNKDLYCLFSIFSGVTIFPNDYFDIEPIRINMFDKDVEFDRMKFNVKNGKVINIYFTNSMEDFLKYSELLLFFTSPEQIDNLVKIFEDVRKTL